MRLKLINSNTPRCFQNSEGQTVVLLPATTLQFRDRAGKLQTIVLPEFVEVVTFDESVKVCPLAQAHLAVQDPFSSATSLTR